MKYQTFALPSLRLIILACLCCAQSVTAAPGGGGSSNQNSTPDLSFYSDKSSYTFGETALLTWSSTDTKFCSASGDWTGKLPTAGSYKTSPLDATRQYTLKCSARGGGVEQTLALATSSAPAVPPATSPDPAPAPVSAPVIQLNVDTAVVASGGMVTVSWTASDATSCAASGGWFGDKSLAGSETVGPVYASTDFSLNCTGAGGSVIASAQTAVLSALEINWMAPKENVDGSPLTDLAEFRIYYGGSSRNYSETLRVADPQAVSQTLQLVSGDWFIALTAVDRDGNESGYSNEVIRTAP